VPAKSLTRFSYFIDPPLIYINLPPPQINSWHLIDLISSNLSQKESRLLGILLAFTVH